MNNSSCCLQVATKYQVEWQLGLRLTEYAKLPYEVGAVMNPILTDGETEAQKEATCSKSHEEGGSQLEFESRSV